MCYAIRREHARKTSPVLISWFKFIGNTILYMPSLKQTKINCFKDVLNINRKKAHILYTVTQGKTTYTNNRDTFYHITELIFCTVLVG